VVTPNSAYLRLAVVYNKQSKKKEASDILFNMVSEARNAATRMESPSRNQQLAPPRQAFEDRPDPTPNYPPPAPLSMF
jgi:hypothetical protein